MAVPVFYNSYPVSKDFINFETTIEKPPLLTKREKELPSKALPVTSKRHWKENSLQLIRRSGEKPPEEYSDFKNKTGGDACTQTGDTCNHSVDQNGPSDIKDITKRHRDKYEKEIRYVSESTSCYREPLTRSQTPRDRNWAEQWSSPGRGEESVSLQGDFLTGDNRMVGDNGNRGQTQSSTPSREHILPKLTVKYTDVVTTDVADLDLDCAVQRSDEHTKELKKYRSEFKLDNNKNTTIRKDNEKEPNSKDSKERLSLGSKECVIEEKESGTEKLGLESKNNVDSTMQVTSAFQHGSLETGSVSLEDTGSDALQDNALKIFEKSTLNPKADEWVPRQSFQQQSLQPVNQDDHILNRRNLRQEVKDLNTEARGHVNIYNSHRPTKMARLDLKNESSDADGGSVESLGIPQLMSSYQSVTNESDIKIREGELTHSAKQEVKDEPNLPVIPKPYNYIQHNKEHYIIYERHHGAHKCLDQNEDETDDLKEQETVDLLSEKRGNGRSDKDTGLCLANGKEKIQEGNTNCYIENNSEVDIDIVTDMSIGMVAQNGKLDVDLPITGNAGNGKMTLGNEEGQNGNLDIELPITGNAGGGKMTLGNEEEQNGNLDIELPITGNAGGGKMTLGNEREQNCDEDSDMPLRNEENISFDKDFLGSNGKKEQDPRLVNEDRLFGTEDMDLCGRGMKRKRVMNSGVDDEEEMYQDSDIGEVKVKRTRLQSDVRSCIIEIRIFRRILFSSIQFSSIQFSSIQFSSFGLMFRNPYNPFLSMDFKYKRLFTESSSVRKRKIKYIRRKEQRKRRDEKLEQKKWVRFEGTTSSEIRQPLRKRSLNLLNNGRQHDHQHPEESPPLGAVHRGQLEQMKAQSCPLKKAFFDSKSSTSKHSFVNRGGLFTLILFSMLCFSHAGNPNELLKNEKSEGYMSVEPFAGAYVHISRLLDVLAEIYEGWLRPLDREKMYDILDYDELDSKEINEWIPLKIQGEIIVNSSQTDICGKGKILLKKISSYGTTVSNNLTEWTEVQICINDPLSLEECSLDILPNNISLQPMTEEMDNTNLEELLFCFNKLNCEHCWCIPHTIENFHEAFYNEFDFWIWMAVVAVIFFFIIMFDQIPVLPAEVAILCVVVLTCSGLILMFYFWRQEEKDENSDEKDQCVFLRMLWFGLFGRLSCCTDSLLSSFQLYGSAKLGHAMNMNISDINEIIHCEDFKTLRLLEPCLTKNIEHCEGYIKCSDCDQSSCFKHTAHNQDTNVKCTSDDPGSNFNGLGDDQGTNVNCTSEHQDSKVNCLNDDQETKVNSLSDNQDTNFMCTSDDQSTKVNCLSNDKDAKVNSLHDDQDTNVKCTSDDQGTNVNGSDDDQVTCVNGSDTFQDFRKPSSNKDCTLSKMHSRKLCIILVLALVFSVFVILPLCCAHVILKRSNCLSVAESRIGPITQESCQVGVNLNRKKYRPCDSCEDESSDDEGKAFICMNYVDKVTPENIEKSKLIENHERLARETYRFYENGCNKHEQLTVADDEIRIREPKGRKSYVPTVEEDSLFAESEVHFDDLEVDITTKKFEDDTDNEDIDEIIQENDEIRLNNHKTTDTKTIDDDSYKEDEASPFDLENIQVVEKKNILDRKGENVKRPDDDASRDSVKTACSAEGKVPNECQETEKNLSSQTDQLQEELFYISDVDKDSNYTQLDTVNIPQPSNFGAVGPFETSEEDTLPSDGCTKKENIRSKVLPTKRHVPTNMFSKKTTKEFEDFLTLQRPRYTKVTVESATKKNADITFTEDKLQIRSHTWLPISDLPAPKIDLTTAHITQFEPLMVIIDLIAAGTPPTPHVSMRYELLRFCTLRSYPKEDKPFLIKLAEAGFYYASDGDGVVCYCCGVRRYNWTEEDNPRKVHERINPSCKFLRKNDEVNVPVEFIGPYSEELMAIMDIPEPIERPEVSEDVNNDWAPERVRAPASQQQNRPNQSGTNALGINTAIPKHSQYATKTAREASYSSWPDTSSHTPQVLADAGFFYAGFGDCVRCFYCGIGLRHWTSEDDPWIEHARWSRNCVFVKQKKGEEFVNLVQLAVQYSQDNEAQAGGTAGELQHVQEIERILLSDAAQSVLEMGYQPRIIKNAIEQIIKQNANTKITAQLLMEKVLEIEETENSTRSPPVPSAAAGTTAAGVAKPSVQSTKSEGAKAGEGDKLPAKSNDEKKSDKDSKSSLERKKKDTNNSKKKIETKECNEGTQDPKQIKKENEELKEQTLCKVCLDNTVCIVFLPCGHLVTCADCAPAMRKCPICRALVKGTVRTYMS